MTNTSTRATLRSSVQQNFSSLLKVSSALESRESLVAKCENILPRASWFPVEIPIQNTTCIKYVNTIEQAVEYKRKIN